MKAYTLSDVIQMAEAIEDYTDTPETGTIEYQIQAAAMDIRIWAEDLEAAKENA